MKDIPAYEQVKNTVITYIRNHRLKPGDKLPPEGEFRRQLGWSRVTVMRGLDELEAEGLIERIKGSGNYVANPSKRKRPLRILISTRYPASMDYGYTGLLLQGISTEAAAEEVSVLYYDKEAQTHLEAFRKSGGDGVLLIPLGIDELHKMIPLQEQGVPLLAVANRSRGLSIPCVCTDNFGIMKEGIHKLYELGHRRIAYLTHGAGASDVQERLLGYQQGLLEHGIPVNSDILLFGVKNLELALIRHWWLGLSEKPSALIVSQDLVAPIMGLMNGLGLKVPQDISLISTDDGPPLANMSPKITAFRQPVMELGRLGMRKLISLIRGADGGSLEEILPIQFIRRESIGAAKTT